MANNQNKNENVDTKKYQKVAGEEDVKFLMKHCGRENEDPLCGSRIKPRMFYDKNGQLHIVLYDSNEITEMNNYLLDAANPPNNANKGYEDGDGIYLHLASSPPLDKVCPCKLLPNEPCNPG